ncbi:MAG TPA: choline-sulfatase [Verrucomicrobiales bacterium]|nr:choline-sulfatase [Verrucomicrobiales bacterium]
MKISCLRLFCPVLLATAACWLSGPLAAADKPNILFIAIDDLNDWVGCLGGHPQVETPHIDRLARSGTLFSNAHCQSPLCNPSRTSLLTGRRPTSTGIYGLSPWFRNLEEFKDLVTIPQHLAANGYRTLSTGKIFHGGYGRGKDDTEFQVLGPAASVGARPEEKIIGPTPGGNNPLMDWGTFPHEDEEKGDWQVASWAVEQLDAKPEGPFFLSAGFFLPHVPCYATRKWFEIYPDEHLELPLIQRDDRADTPMFSWFLHWDLPEPRLSWCEENNQWKPLVHAYLASISFVDSQVGRIVEALDRNGYRDNTVIVLWSDHGYHLGEKQITGKNTLWERSTRVPLIFSGPGIDDATICKQPVELLDIFPTLNELCSLPAVGGLEGHSLVPQLKNSKAPRSWPAITSHNQGNHAVRSERFRYIRYADGSEEFYDMINDPQEWHNLIDDATHAPLVAEHRQWLPKVDRPPAPGSAHRVLTYDPATKEAVWEGRPVRLSEWVK